jgi:hypothetical protein
MAMHVGFLYPAISTLLLVFIIELINGSQFKHHHGFMLEVSTYGVEVYGFSEMGRGISFNVSVTEYLNSVTELWKLLLYGCRKLIATQYIDQRPTK